MADAITGNTQISATKADLIASVAQLELRAKTNLLPTVTDVSQFAVKGARSISFPKLGSFTVINRASGVAGDAEAIASTADQLDLDINAYIAYLVDPTDAVQSNIDYEAELAKRAGAAHGRFVDAQILSELETVGEATATASPLITRDVVLEMRRSLMERNAEMNDVVLVLSPEQEEAMLKIAEFSQADIYGSAVIPNGMIGRVYGVPVLINNQVSTGQYYMYEKTGVGIGFQLRPNVSEQLANEFGSQAMRVAIDQKFGVKGMQLGEQGVLATESALVIKDGNV